MVVQLVSEGFDKGPDISTQEVINVTMESEKPKRRGRPKKDKPAVVDSGGQKPEKKTKVKKSRSKKASYGNALLDQLVDDEVVRKGQSKHPKINGLLRLVNEHKKGIKRVATEVDQGPTNTNGMVAVVTKTITFGDDTVSSSAADAFTYNMAERISVFPTATADTRALSRALRLALGISVATAEEIEQDKKKAGDKVDEQEVVDVPPELKKPTAAQIMFVNKRRTDLNTSDEAFLKALSCLSYTPKTLEEVKTLADMATVIKEMQKLDKDAAACQTKKSTQ